MVLDTYLCMMQIFRGMSNRRTAGFGGAFERLRAVQCAGSCLLRACVLIQQLHKSDWSCMNRPVLTHHCSMRRHAHLTRS